MAASPNTPNPALPKFNVLLVEDNPGDAILVERHIARADPHLLAASVDLQQVGSLTEALGRIDDESFDAMLLDLGLPESQGLDTLEAVLAHAPTVPVVVLTGLSDHNIALRAVQSGAEDFLHKDDLDADRLCMALRFAIDRKARDEELHLKTHVIESAELALMLVETGDASSGVVFANKACETLTGHPIESWKGTGIRLLFGEETDDDTIAELEQAAHIGQPTTVEAKTYRADGTPFWNGISAIPIKDQHGQSTHMLYSFRDVSEDRRLRARMADIDRMVTLGTVAAGVAHEINNPLSYISGNVQFALILLEEDENFKTLEQREQTWSSLVEALHDAMDGSRRVRDVVRDLHKLAGRSTELDYSTEQLSITEPLQTSLSIARNHITDRAKIVCDFADGVPDVIGNESKLGQVFLNILINAAQAIPPGNIEDNEVSIEVFSRGDDVVAAISDTGAGIPEKDRARLFEPFFSTKPADEGTGLGLAISKNIITELGGRIEVDSTVGEGTTVSVVLPAYTWSPN
jgi:PAS domain S-box-containing protein